MCFYSSSSFIICFFNISPAGHSLPSRIEMSKIHMTRHWNFPLADYLTFHERPCPRISLQQALGRSVVCAYALHLLDQKMRQIQFTCMSPPSHLRRFRGSRTISRSYVASRSYYGLEINHIPKMWASIDSSYAVGLLCSHCIFIVRIERTHRIELLRIRLRVPAPDPVVIIRLCIMCVLSLVKLKMLQMVHSFR